MTQNERAQLKKKIGFGKNIQKHCLFQVILKKLEFGWFFKSLFWGRFMKISDSGFGNCFPETCARKPVSGNRFPETGLRKPVSGNRFPETCFRKPVSGNRFPDTGFRTQVSGNRFPETGFRKTVSETGNRNLHKTLSEQTFQKSPKLDFFKTIWKTQWFRTFFPNPIF